jgi:hypothetical protein
MISIAKARRRCATCAIAAALGLAVLLSGCSSAIDAIPTALGGLPEGVPERPPTPPFYPAVHDMPPPRADVALSEDERKRLRQELTVTRDRIEKEGTDITTATATTTTPPATTTPPPTTGTAAKP